MHVMARYCRGVDRGDKELIKSAYHADGRDERGAAKGPPADFANEVVDRMDKSGTVGQHHITNVYLEIDGDRAIGETYFMALVPETGASLRYSFGRYLDTFERRNGAWKIKERKVVLDFIPTDENGKMADRLKPFLRGARGPADPSHGIFKAAV